MAVDNLDRANMVVAVAAGNSAPGHFTVESPGMAQRALSAGASTVPHFVGAPLSVGGTTYGVAAGDRADRSAPISRRARRRPQRRRSAEQRLHRRRCRRRRQPAAGSLAGKIALISRGACTFSVKVRNAAGRRCHRGHRRQQRGRRSHGDGRWAARRTSPPSRRTWPRRTPRRRSWPTTAPSATIGAALSYFYDRQRRHHGRLQQPGPDRRRLPRQARRRRARRQRAVVDPGAAPAPRRPASPSSAAPRWRRRTSPARRPSSWRSTRLVGRGGPLGGRQHGGPRRAEGLRERRPGRRRQRHRHRSREPGKRGAGRVALDPVSISFGAVPSGSGQPRQASVTLRNLSGAPQTFGLAVIDARPRGELRPEPLRRDARRRRVGHRGRHDDRARGASGDQQAVLDVMLGDKSVAHAALYTLMK